ncbi:MAG: hypothetical protein ACTHNU_06035 [Gaiellales bacterium]
MADWVTISALATAGGTLVLAGATFASVRSANRAARAAEASMLAGLRPLLLPSHLEDAPLKVSFFDNRWFTVPGGCGVAEATKDAVYLAMSLRNVGTGIAVLHGWWFYPDRSRGAEGPPDTESMHRLNRDLYVPAGDVGFWQGVFRDPASPEFRLAGDAIGAREMMMVDVLYGDQEGGQRVISRFSLASRDDGGWIVTSARHWNLDRPDPR